MVRQRDPVATAEFAGGRDGASGAPGRVGGRERRCGGGGDVGCQDGAEECREGLVGVFQRGGGGRLGEEVVC